MNLAEKLATLAGTMTGPERANLKLILGVAAGGLAQHGRPPEHSVEAAAFSTTLSSIAKLQPHRDHVPINGVVYRGRPDFVTDELLAALQGESERLRSTAIRFYDHLVVSGAPLARAVGFSTQLNALIEAHTLRALPTEKANHLYYDEVGLGIEPHVDNDEFSLNAIMMLKHEYEANPSALVLYPPKSAPERIFLLPGELIVMYADSILHARERMAPRERVSIVAFGFQPVT